MRHALESLALVVLTAAAILICADILGWIDFAKPTTRQTVTITRQNDKPASAQPYYITICTPSGGCIDIGIN